MFGSTGTTMVSLKHLSISRLQLQQVLHLKQKQFLILVYLDLQMEEDM